MGKSKNTDRVIAGHRYDGIREYDNPMPAWWVWIFWATGVFAVFYVVGITYFGWINTYEQDLEIGVAEIAALREAAASSSPTFDAAMLASYTGVPEHISAGAEYYAQYCAACHGAEGQGLIGPNLTDEYWLHGNTEEDIFRVTSEGILDKGMPAWDGALTPEQRAQTVAFIRSIYDTNPAGAKEPQGEAYP
ncbi:MAG: cbb3-type cytochrome c oxidase N-terminal domain-containing protein [Bacteroidota bacterium]